MIGADAVDATHYDAYVAVVLSALLLAYVARRVVRVRRAMPGSA